jgi:hypothetical protein
MVHLQGKVGNGQEPIFMKFGINLENTKLKKNIKKIFAMKLNFTKKLGILFLILMV